MKNNNWTPKLVLNHLSTLRKADNERFGEMFASFQLAIKDALVSADKAVIKAENAAEKRFEGMNEFRAAMSDQQALYMPRAEFDQVRKSQDEKIASLETRLGNRESIETRVANKVGQGEGINKGWLVLLGVVSLISMVLSAWASTH